MPADIRSFFGAKGNPPAKPAASKKETDQPKKAAATRGKSRVVLDDSDDEPTASVKPAAKATTKKKAGTDPATGVAITATDYFANAGDKKSQATPKAASKIRTEVEVRISPRTKPKPSVEPSSAPVRAPKKSDTSPAPKPATKATAKHARPKKPVIAYNKHDSDYDDDAFMDDDDEGDDDIFAADVRGRAKRKNDDYVEEDSDDDILPQAKRVASRARPRRGAVKDEESEAEEATKPSRKRKSPASDSEASKEEDSKPRKKPAAKPRVAKTKSAITDDPNIQNILDNVPTVRPPTPPPKDNNAKFNWSKTVGGGGNSGPPPAAGSIDIPEGQEDCLTGLSFVFTGLLKSIGRDEAQALVKRYGGKVTGAPSSKTSFVVLGDDAGPSKLAKIQKHGIKTIDEVGLFHLISTLPAHGGSGSGAEKAREKREAEAEKVKQQAAEMEAEEKSRKAEAERARKEAGAKGAVAPPPPPAPNSQLWTTKYAPTALNHICGNKAQVEKIKSWLENWQKSKKYDFKKRGADGLGGERAIIVSGPPGIGKTTAAHLAAKLAGYDVLESNASDTRSKKLVENGVSDVINNTSLLGYFAGDGKKVDQARKNIVLIMDEVDGMSAGDRGGVGALAKFCKKTEVPLILICNERRLPKMKPFDHVAFDIRFSRPTVDQIRSRIMTICHREGLGKMPPQVIDALIEGCNKDIRQIINMIHSIKLDGSPLDYSQTKTMTKAWEKHVILKPWDICQKMLAGGLFQPASKATLNDKIELYFNDHEFSYLMIQENYLSTKPIALSGKGYNRKQEQLKHLELVEKAAESISDGDLVDRMIHGPQQQWSLMPTHAVFSSVRPASYIAGQLMGSNFTSWLGNNSKAGKLGRFVREIHAHMRLKSSGDHNEVRQQYLPVLWNQMIKRLGREGKDAIDDVIELMDSYYLTRDDFDAIKDLGVGYQDESRAEIETQTKAAFTRMYNSKSHPVPFMKASNVQVPKAAAKEVPDLEEAIEEEDDAAVVADPAADDEDEELDLKKDKYIKQPKAKRAKKAAATTTTKKKTTAARKAADAEDDFIDDDDDEPKSSTRGKGAAGRGAKSKASGRTKK